jgi:hypothetical protein
MLLKFMSTLMEIEEVAAQLPSPDFVQLLEDLHDLAAARVELGELRDDPTAAISWQKLDTELDALSVEIQRRAEKTLRHLTDRKLYRRLRDTIDTLAVEPRPHGCTKLSGDLSRVARLSVSVVPCFGSGSSLHAPSSTPRAPRSGCTHPRPSVARLFPLNTAD